MHRGFLLPLLMTAPMLCPAGEGPSVAARCNSR